MPSQRLFNSVSAEWAACDHHHGNDHVRTAHSLPDFARWVIEGVYFLHVAVPTHSQGAPGVFR
jgi:hypothetical protein